MTKVYGLYDWGGTHTQGAIFTTEGFSLEEWDLPSNPNDYEGSIEGMAAAMQSRLEQHDGLLVAGAIAIAGEVNPEGMLTKAGTLTSFEGRYPGRDFESAIGLPEGSVDTGNDLERAALSQQEVNRLNGRPVEGTVATISSGFNTADFHKDGGTVSHEDGHLELQSYAIPGGRRGIPVCPCGLGGCIEAHISGNGIKLNRGMASEVWLEKPLPAARFARDVADATLQLIEQRRSEGFRADEWRWMGGVALGQPFLMKRANQLVRDRLGDRSPVFDTVTLGRRVGLDGNFVAAQRRARVI